MVLGIWCLVTGFSAPAPFAGPWRAHSGPDDRSNARGGAWPPACVSMVNCHRDGATFLVSGAAGLRSEGDDSATAVSRRAAQCLCHCAARADAHPTNAGMCGRLWPCRVPGEAGLGLILAGVMGDARRGYIMESHSCPLCLYCPGVRAPSPWAEQEGGDCLPGRKSGGLHLHVLLSS